MSASAPTTLESAAEWLRKRFDADASRGVGVAYELDLTGPSGGVLAIRIDDGRLDIEPLEPGTAPPSSGSPPTARLHLSAADFYAILTGRENSEMLYMASRIRVEGDLAAALRFRKFFRRRA